MGPAWHVLCPCFVPLKKHRRARQPGLSDKYVYFVCEPRKFLTDRIH